MLPKEEKKKIFYVNYINFTKVDKGGGTTIVLFCGENAVCLGIPPSKIRQHFCNNCVLWSMDQCGAVPQIIFLL